MKNLYILFSFFLLVIILSSCQKSPDAIAVLKKTCLYNSKTDYFKKWANTFTEIDVYNTSNVIQNKSFIYPNGYFKLNNDLTYNVESDNVPLMGTWTVTDSCQLELDPGKPAERKFDVLILSSDSLTLRRKSNDTVYTQHYIAYKCPDVTALEYQWNNTYTVEENYGFNGVYSTTIYPVGYFKLNSDFTYNRPSDGVDLDGTWELDPNSCQLVLDLNTTNQRAFDIQQLTTDSLTIWRKDTVAKVNYLQHYKKN